MSDAFHIEGTSQLLRSHVFDVERRTIGHDGTTFDRDVAVHRGAVAVLAVNDVGEIGLIRQYRSTFDRFTWEIPAGTLDVDGEEPLATAQRELLEEMGVVASDWTLLGRFMNSPGWTDQVMTIYEARGLADAQRAPAGPEESSSTVHWLAKEELRETLRREPAIDSTMVVALHRVFGNFFDGA